ncbi:MAG TPA: tetratricopeptide repeat protein [Pyrinomonadaceae bacterium]|nr:tetratricopeptide repeat protein [Pyrinomonadaceae bacterium]
MSFPQKALLLLFICWCTLLAAPSKATAQQNASNYDRLERAASLISAGQLAGAEGELNAVLRRSPEDANALNLLGVIRAQQRRNTEAEQLFLRAVKSAPTLMGAYLNLARLYLELEKQERALWAFTEAAKLSPEDADINLNLALIYERRREYERALEQLSKIPSSQMGAEHLYVLIKSHLGLGHVSEAQSLAASLKQPGRVPADIATPFAAAFAERELFDDAIQILEAAKQSGAPSFPLLYNLGTAYYRKRDFTRAEAFYTEALNVKQDDVDTLRALARVARAQGELEKALAHLVRARKLAPKSEAVLYDFGWTALNLNLLFDALSVLEELQRAHPDDPAYLYALGIARLQNGEAQKTVDLLNRFIKLRPEESGGYYVLGAALYALKQFPQARAMLERSVELEPYPDAQYYLGMIAYNEGDDARAAQWLERALKAEPNYASARAALGMTYSRQKNYKAARTELERAMQLNPKDATAAYQLGLVYARLGEKDLAQGMFSTADKLRAEKEKESAVRFRLIDPPK